MNKFGAKTPSKTMDMPAPRKAQMPKALVAERKSSDKAAKKGGKKD